MLQKVIWMPLLIFGTLNSLFFSCSKEIDKRQLQRYVYANNSDYSILINRYSNDIRKDFFLQKDDSLIQEIDLGFGSTENLIIHSDSIKVIFDNNKVLKFSTTLSRDKDLLKIDSYQNYQHENILISKYIFSNTDYGNAEDCNENCN